MNTVSNTMDAGRDACSSGALSAILEPPPLTVHAGEGIAELLPPLLRELREDDCVHSWRDLLPAAGTVDADTARDLIARENLRRPTTVFVYTTASGGGSAEVVAAAAVSERVRADFRHEGIPVLARCYVRRAHRGNGLYRRLLGHRLAWCRTRWGASLRGVHLGSASRWVRDRACSLDDGLRFVHVGDELLPVDGRSHRVGDLLAFTPAWKQALLRAGERFGSGPAACRLRVLLGDLVEVGLPAAGLADVVRAHEAARAEGGAAPDDAELRALLDVAKAIPVVP